MRFAVWEWMVRSLLILCLQSRRSMRLQAFFLLPSCTLISEVKTPWLPQNHFWNSLWRTNKFSLSLTLFLQRRFLFSFEVFVKNWRTFLKSSWQNHKCINWHWWNASHPSLYTYNILSKPFTPFTAPMKWGVNHSLYQTRWIGWRVREAWYMYSIYARAYGSDKTNKHTFQNKFSQFPQFFLILM